MHIGHLAIIRHLIDSRNFDMVYLIVSPKNPLKDTISSDSAERRYLAAKEAVARHFKSSVKVDDIELHMPEPHYTIKTLNALRKREPENSFRFVMGADNLAGIRRWRDYTRILKEYGVTVYPRAGYDLQTIILDLTSESPEYKIDTIEAPLVEISSTQIRKAIELGEDVRRFLM